MLTICESIGLNLLPKEGLIFAIGNELRFSGHNEKKVIPWKLPRKIHGIDSSPNGIIVVYGETYFLLLRYKNSNFEYICEGQITDWISRAQFFPSLDSLFLVTAHSVAMCLSIDQNEKTIHITKRSSSADKSTLYCSFLLGNHWEDSVVFGGNALGEVIIWQPSIKTKDNRSPVLQRISAHDGVIFSIDVDLSFKMMITTSDDRSVRFWNLDNITADGFIDWKFTTFSLLTTSYAHTARVFKGKIINKENEPYVLSCGEDSQICLWNRMGELLHKFNRSFGAFLNCAYCTHTVTAFASSSSGNIVKYSLSNYFSTDLIKEIDTSNLQLDYLAKVKFLKRNIIIGITNKNDLLMCKLSNQWHTIEKNLRYKCTVLEVFNEIIFIGGPKFLIIYRFSSKIESINKEFEGKITDGIIRSIHKLTENEEYLICDDQGRCKYISDGNYDFAKSFQIPQSKERWITAAIKVDNFIFVSNRHGNAFLYFLFDEFTLKSEIKHIHGYLGITDILLDRNLEKFVYIKTCGHDKTLKTIKIDKTNKTMEIVHTENIPIAWVEQVQINNKNEEFLLGFNDNHFVIWQKSHEFLFKLPCGGGHRFWDIRLDFNNNKMHLVFIKDKKLYSCFNQLINISSSPIRLSYNRWHVKPCNALRYIETNNSNIILVSAGEDNILKFSQYSSEYANIFLKSEIHLHISNIRTITIIKDFEDTRLIFSAGGRSQICVTQLYLPDIVLEEKCNFMLKSTDFERKYQRNAQEIDFDPETRIMSLDVTNVANDQSYVIYAGCSDGYIRIFKYKPKLIEFYNEYFYNKCILHVRVIEIKKWNRKILITSSTDGNLSFWNLDSNGDSTFSSPFVFQHHNNGINSLDICQTNDYIYVVTGGDDQNVVFSKIYIAENLLKISEVKNLNFLHTAQVNGVKISDNKKYLYSVSVDQKICKINLSDFRLEKCVFTCIADVKGLELRSISSDTNLCIIYGCGVQSIML